MSSKTVVSYEHICLDDNRTAAPNPRLVPCGVNFFNSDSSSDSEKKHVLDSDSARIFYWSPTTTPKNSENLFDVV
jgi:hypothetical protein